MAGGAPHCSGFQCRRMAEKDGPAQFTRAVRDSCCGFHHPGALPSANTNPDPPPKTITRLTKFTFACHWRVPGFRVEYCEGAFFESIARGGDVPAPEAVGVPQG